MDAEVKCPLRDAGIAHTPDRREREMQQWFLERPHDPAPQEKQIPLFTPAVRLHMERLLALAVALREDAVEDTFLRLLDGGDQRLAAREERVQHGDQQRTVGACVMAAPQRIPGCRLRLAVWNREHNRVLCVRAQPAAVCGDDAEVPLPGRLVRDRQTADVLDVIEVDGELRCAGGGGEGGDAACADAEVELLPDRDREAEALDGEERGRFVSWWCGGEFTFFRGGRGGRRIGAGEVEDVRGD